MARVAGVLLAIVVAVGCARRSPSHVRVFAVPQSTQAESLAPPDSVLLDTDERERFRNLWRSGRFAQLDRELRELNRRMPVTARAAADTAFLHGDHAAAFHAYDGRTRAEITTMTIGGWYEQAATTLRGYRFSLRDQVTAALLIGDAEAACGRYREARAAWERSLQESVDAREPHRYYPEWTSALRRLVAYRTTRDRSRDDVLCITAEVVEAQQRARRAESERIVKVRDAAWNSLARGDAHGALSHFDEALPYWRRNQFSGRGYADVERGIVIAALLAREDARAEHELLAIRAESRGIARGTALVFAGRWNDAFSAYRDDTASEPLEDGIDPVIARGADAAHAGDLRRAITLWSAPPDGHGPNYLEDEQTALIGLARARLGDWSGAVDAWLAATNMGRPVPEWESLERGNITALEMLYHFRDRYPRGDHRYQLRTNPGPRG